MKISQEQLLGTKLETASRDQDIGIKASRKCPWRFCRAFIGDRLSRALPPKLAVHSGSLPHHGPTQFGRNSRINFTTKGPSPQTPRQFNREVNWTWTKIRTAIMGYTEDDQLAINTIRLLAVSYSPLKAQKAVQWSSCLWLCSYPGQQLNPS